MIRFPWQNPKTAVRLALFYGAAEFLRSGFFVGLFPLFGLEYLKLPLSTLGLLTSLHYGSEALTKVGAVWLSNRLPFGLGFLASAALAFLTFWGFFLLPPYAFPLIAVAWGIATAPIWPRIAAYLMQTAKPEHQGRAVTYAWLIVAPLIGLGSFGVGFLSKHELAWGQRALAVGGVLLLLLALGVVRLRFPVAEVKRKGYAYRRFLILIIPAFLQNLAPHLLTTVLFPFLKQAEIGFLPLLVSVALGGGTFLVLLRPVARFADRRDPALVTGLSTLLAALAFGGLALGDPNRALYWTAVCIGAALALYIPGWNALIVRSLPQNERGEGWGAISTVSGAAIAVGPAVGAFAWDLLGPQGPFLLGLSLLVALLFYYLVFLRRIMAGLK